MTAFELYLELGFKHILDDRLFTDVLTAEGYDHLLFIVALAAVYKVSEYKKVLILVTAFTIGHSITLLLSTLNIVRISMPVIEFLIPLTIVLTALYNLWKRHELLDKKSLRLRYWAALLFGFIHGLGFSNYLKSLLGNEDSLLIPLLGFNIGLEIGQILIVICMLILHFLWNKVFGLQRNTWVWLMSGVVLIFAIPILYRTALTVTGI